MSQKNIKTDVDLVKLSLVNPDFFSELVDRYEKKLLRYVSRLIQSNESVSEDVLQEIFIKIYRNLNSFDQSLKFSSWAYRIAHNESINYLKKLKKYQVVALESDSDEVVSLIEVLKSEIDLPNELNLKQLKKVVHQILSSLDVRYREVLYLYYIEDYSYLEMSDILKKPAGTIATLINRAKKQFRQLFQDSNFNF